jgi:hypothetical protein
MSRGPGKRQKAILDMLTSAAKQAERRRRGEVPADPLKALTGSPRPPRAVSGRDISGDEGWMRVELDDDLDEDDWTVTRSQRESTRRALRSLEARGLIEVELLPRRSAPLIGMPAMPASLVARLKV